MKLGSAWYGFREQTPTNYFEIAARLDIDYVEISLYDRVASDELWPYEKKSGIESIRAEADRAGVEIAHTSRRSGHGGASRSSSAKSMRASLRVPSSIFFALTGCVSQQVRQVMLV